jgi:hypothetical protein
MEIDIELDREKQLSENEPLMALLERVEAEIGNPKKRRRIVDYKEFFTRDTRKITIEYITFCMGYSQGSKQCTFITDKNYKLLRLLS